MKNRIVESDSARLGTIMQPQFRLLFPGFPHLKSIMKERSHET